jgi:hypothetical protein
MRVRDALRENAVISMASDQSRREPKTFMLLTVAPEIRGA